MSKKIGFHDEIIAEKGIFNSHCLEDYINSCSIFVYTTNNGQEHMYLYGGGVVNKADNNIILWYDQIRIHKYLKISISDIVHIQYGKHTTDILFKDGSWLMCICICKYKLMRCDFANMKFEDKRVIDIKDDVAVVNLPIIYMTNGDRYNINKYNFMSEDTLLYRYPLTIAYVKKNDSIYIGYWDINGNNFVGNLRKYWKASLDIGI